MTSRLACAALIAALFSTTSASADGLTRAPGGLPTYVPTGVAVGASGAIYVSSDVENAIYKAVKK
ncbi:hypothetical protein [Bradyrhizobium yuanmingense]|uniref:hypothetical protein n=1 Tax=Bradyrhizobium yuanmingense TaxID=108015 RepID=UPI0023B97D27|nr:hypothetical protein [Bradyrhizobium yuanmingense]MDF0496879.1 hypothetical protein [Bradyrhizobium yuanmingense]